ncbi:peptidylprolyl isomerase fpr3 [Conglomerata obtusa]
MGPHFSLRITPTPQTYKFSSCTMLTKITLDPLNDADTDLVVCQNGIKTVLCRLKPRVYENANVQFMFYEGDVVTFFASGGALVFVMGMGVFEYVNDDKPAVVVDNLDEVEMKNIICIKTNLSHNDKNVFDKYEVCRNDDTKDMISKQDNKNVAKDNDIELVDKINKYADIDTKHILKNYLKENTFVNEKHLEGNGNTKDASNEEFVSIDTGKSNENINENKRIIYNSNNIEDCVLPSIKETTTKNKNLAIEKTMHIGNRFITLCIKNKTHFTYENDINFFKISSFNNSGEYYNKNCNDRCSLTVDFIVQKAVIGNIYQNHYNFTNCNYQYKKNCNVVFDSSSEKGICLVGNVLKDDLFNGTGRKRLRQYTKKVKKIKFSVTDKSKSLENTNESIINEEKNCEEIDVLNLPKNSIVDCEKESIMSGEKNVEEKDNFNSKISIADCRNKNSIGKEITEKYKETNIKTNIKTNEDKFCTLNKPKSNDNIKINIDKNKLNENDIINNSYKIEADYDSKNEKLSGLLDCSTSLNKNFNNEITAKNFEINEIKNQNAKSFMDYSINDVSKHSDVNEIEKIDKQKKTMNNVETNNNKNQVNKCTEKDEHTINNDLLENKNGMEIINDLSKIIDNNISVLHMHEKLSINMENCNQEKEIQLKSNKKRENHAKNMLQNNINKIDSDNETYNINADDISKKYKNNKTVNSIVVENKTLSLNEIPQEKVNITHTPKKGIIKDNFKDDTKQTELKKQGVEIITIKEGTGKACQKDDLVKILYKGKLENGKVFSKSNKKPFCFTLGRNSVIKGWEIGVLGMKIGETRRLIIDPKYGYGNKAVGKIPANSKLIFKVTLIE